MVFLAIPKKDTDHFKSIQIKSNDALFLQGTGRFIFGAPPCNQGIVRQWFKAAIKVIRSSAKQIVHQNSLNEKSSKVNVAVLASQI
jgi:hypothetical protein